MCDSGNPQAYEVEVVVGLPSSFRAPFSGVFSIVASGQQPATLEVLALVSQTPAQDSPARVAFAPESSLDHNRYLTRVSVNLVAVTNSTLGAFYYYFV